ncbi:MAG TPA: 3-methyl-2-oxobutanoate hydroxymethyltransferase [Deltaproteobacteria bacterium]|nr:3-methyl-2-oxobutanoate hydroxymethyltransferase [Deltaproteobacteria bacterium]
MTHKDSKVTIGDLRLKKQQGKKITRVVLWDYPMACIADRAGVDMILVGDSVGMCILGYPNTLPVTMDEMVHHCKAVTRGAVRSFVVGDLPFMSYETGVGDAVRNAGRLVKEAGVDAVKIEGGTYIREAVQAISQSGIPVHGHIGLTPQKIKQLGGFKTQGKTIESAVELFNEAKILSEAGCFAITVECVPPIVGKLMSERLPDTIIISAGAGPYCDGQSANLHDMIGLTQGKTPKFSKQYADVNSIVESCIKSYSNETEHSEFPATEHCYEIEEELSTRIEDAIGKIK